MSNAKSPSLLCRTIASVSLLTAIVIGVSTSSMGGVPFAQARQIANDSPTVSQVDWIHARALSHELDGVTRRLVDRARDEIFGNHSNYEAVKDLTRLNQKASALREALDAAASDPLGGIDVILPRFYDVQEAYQNSQFTMNWADFSQNVTEDFGQSGTLISELKTTLEAPE